MGLAWATVATAVDRLPSAKRWSAENISSSATKQQRMVSMVMPKISENMHETKYDSNHTSTRGATMKLMVLLGMAYAMMRYVTNVVTS